MDTTSSRGVEANFKPNIFSASASREGDLIKDLCKLILDYSANTKKEISLQNEKDFYDLQHMTKSLKDEDEMLIKSMEAIMAIVTISVRKQILRDRLIKRMTDEKELSTILSNHREEFAQLLWKRRILARKELSVLFQSSTSILNRFGDVIYTGTQETIEAFEKRNKVSLCKDSIGCGYMTQDDCVAMFSGKFYLIQPVLGKLISLSSDRLSFTVANNNMAFPGQSWATVFVSGALWAGKLALKPLIRDVATQIYNQLKRSQINNNELSYVQTIARVIDLVHHGPKIQPSTMAFPLSAVALLRKRLISLGYTISTPEEAKIINHPTAIDIIKQIIKKLERGHRHYFEFAVPRRSIWRVGFRMREGTYFPDDQMIYAGQENDSFGIASDGCVYLNGMAFKYIDDPEDYTLFSGLRTFGVLVDLYLGSISLVVDGKIKGPAFGAGANHFEGEMQIMQKEIITNQSLYPMLSLEGSQPLATVSVNFGSRLFTYNINASPFNQILQISSTKSTYYSLKEDLPKIVESDGKEKGPGDDEKKQMMLEKTFIKNSMVAEPLRSFSQFPPSVYRRSFAATKIQRAFRRYRGRKLRKGIREKQYHAAVIIQRAARRKLVRIRSLKNDAAFIIQKAWRRKLFIKVAIMRCIYRKPIRELHRCATLIQNKWRHWHAFRNSPIAAEYKTPVEELKAKVNLIQDWWKPLHIKRKDRNSNLTQFKAATAIQRIWRGYSLRNLLMPQLRQKLSYLGKLIITHRKQLFEFQSAYVVQNAWRSFIVKKVQSEKKKIRNIAASRIKALWKGYWTRAHALSLCSYGQAVYLAAVRKSLKNSHFILKAYKPCGLVCPKSETIPKKPLDHRDANTNLEEE